MSAGPVPRPPSRGLAAPSCRPQLFRHPGPFPILPLSQQSTEKPQSLRQPRPSGMSTGGSTPLSKIPTRASSSTSRIKPASTSFITIPALPKSRPSSEAPGSGAAIPRLGGSDPSLCVAWLASHSRLIAGFSTRSIPAGFMLSSGVFDDL